jgi:hypothetical protein
MKQTLIVVALLSIMPCIGFSQKKKSEAPKPYYPDKVWVQKEPREVGVDNNKLQAAIEFAISHEIKNPRSMEQNHYQTFGREPFGDAIGPMKDRGEPTGIIIKNGYVIASWGEPMRPDMTHSVAKSFLSATIGLAYDRGLIRNIDDTVYTYMAPIHLYQPIETKNKADYFGTTQLLDLFDTPHNRTITWNDMLRQTSDWEGTLWGKPE